MELILIKVIQKKIVKKGICVNSKINDGKTALLIRGAYTNVMVLV